MGLSGMGLTFFIAAPMMLCFSFVFRNLDNTRVFGLLLNLAQRPGCLPTAHHFPVLMNEEKSHTAKQEIRCIVFAVNSLSPHLSCRGDPISDQNKYVWGIVYSIKE